jgi:hypothetical protein
MCASIDFPLCVTPGLLLIARQTTPAAAAIASRLIQITALA